MNLRQKIRYRTARYLGRSSRKISPERPVISFSFDDFPKSAADAGAAILTRHDIRASYYFCADFAGKVVNGIRQYDIADLTRLAAAGHEIGCHTASHAVMSSLSEARIADEVARNATFLRSAGVDATMRTLAYPFGDVSAATKTRTKPKFEACRSAWAGVNAGNIDLALLKCVCLEPHILAHKPIEAWIAETVACKGWLILLTHDVAEDPSAFGVTPAFLEETARAARASGANILPVAEALDHLSPS